MTCIFPWPQFHAASFVSTLRFSGMARNGHGFRRCPLATHAMNGREAAAVLRHAMKSGAVQTCCKGLAEHAALQAYILNAMSLQVCR